MITWKIPSMDSKTRVCASCYLKGKNLKRCATCQATHYCSKKCQKTDWPSHGRHCALIAEEKEEARKNGQSKQFITKESAFIATLSDAIHKEDSELQMPPMNTYYYVKKDDTNFYLHPTQKYEFIKFKNLVDMEDFYIQDPTFVFYGLQIECIVLKWVFFDT